MVAASRGRVVKIGTYEGSSSRRTGQSSSHVVRTSYDLAVTDPAWLQKLNSLPAGIYPHAHFLGSNPAKTYLTISLSEPFEGFHYKLACGVVCLPAG